MNSTSTTKAISPYELSNTCALKPHRELVRMHVEKIIRHINTELVRCGEQTNSYTTVKGEDGETPSDWYIYHAEVALDHGMYNEVPHELIVEYLAAGWKSVQVSILDNDALVIQLFKHKSGGVKAPESGVVRVRPDDSLAILGLDELPKLPQFDPAPVALL